MVVSADDQTRPRILLLTHPRTASNLLVRILNLDHQPTVCNKTGPATNNDKYGYFFLPTMPLRLGLAYRQLKDWTETERVQMMECFQGCADELLRYAELAEQQRRGVFIKEHLIWMLSPQAEDLAKGASGTEEPLWKVLVSEPNTLESSTKVDRTTQDHMKDETLPAKTESRNETVFPDGFLRSWTPTFLIRHPALVFPSIYRTSVDLEGAEEARKNADGMFCVEMTLRWIRTLCEWFNGEYREGRIAAAPIILDADDIILHPELITKYCALVGLDPDKCQYAWERPTAEEEEKMNFIEKRMKSSLLSSTGIVQKGTVGAELIIGKEKQKWREEFGEEEAQKLETWVAAAMPDYEFLTARRLTA